MKIQIVSDLHVEMADFVLPDTGADVVVMAGDIGVGLGGLEWIVGQGINKPVVYVPGNHEFYEYDLGLIDVLKSEAPPNVHVLNNDWIEIDGVRFVGSILWTDFLLFGEADKFFAMQEAAKSMSDFYLISIGGRRFTPQDAIGLHEQSRTWLEAVLAEPYPGRTVVVTHHAPSSASVHPRFARNLLTPAFASNLESMMGAERVALWVHGHMHDLFDYEIYGTRVVCNPRGYARYEFTNNFCPDFVVEV